MKRIVLGVVAVLTCPCHLPLWLLVLSGTAAGGFLAAHEGLGILALTAAFVAALTLLLRPQRRETRGSGRGPSTSGEAGRGVSEVGGSRPARPEVVAQPGTTDAETWWSSGGAIRSQEP